MPIFEYKCPDCGEVFDEWIPTWREEPKVKCPSCGKGRAEKQISTFSAATDAPSTSSCRPGFFR